VTITSRRGQSKSSLLMNSRAFSWTGKLGAALLLPFLLVVAGCNATGLVLPATPTTFKPAPTATTVALLPVATPTPEEEPVSTSTEQPEPTALPTSEPTSETFATSTPEEIPSSQPEATVESGSVQPTPTLVPRAERVRIFEEVWKTVDDNYLYKGFNGVDWNALHDKYLPLATNAATSDDFYKAISDMVDQLKDDHSRYLSPQDAREEDDLQSGNANYVGIGVLSSPDVTSLLLIFVFPNSPAEKAGLQRRDRITAVDGIPFIDPRTEPSRIRGPRGTAVRLTVKSPGRQSREVSVVRDTINGEIVPTASRLKAAPNIGLLVIPDLWTDDMDALVNDRLRDLLDGPTPLAGLIMDVRGNGGGFRTVLESILGEFVSGDVGTFFNQTSENPFIIQKGPLFDRLKNVPLVVLVDKGSESYTEALAAALQARGRATLVGTPTAGNTETIYRYDFDDGSRLWVAEESFKLPDGTNLEGRGAIPDVRIDKDWTDYTDDDDPYILAALQLLKK
jgi:carboxyl-terminal processing protease